MMRAKRNPITVHRSLLTLLVAAFAGCGTQPTIDEGSYLTYDHPFTEAAAAAARKNAEKVCAERKRVAVRTDTACSLKTCTTSYQCVDGLELEKLQQKK